MRFRPAACTASTILSVDAARLLEAGHPTSNSIDWPDGDTSRTDLPPSTSMKIKLEVGGGRDRSGEQRH